MHRREHRRDNARLAEIPSPRASDTYTGPCRSIHCSGERNQNLKPLLFRSVHARHAFESLDPLFDGRMGTEEADEPAPRKGVHDEHV